MADSIKPIQGSGTAVDLWNQNAPNFSNTVGGWDSLNNVMQLLMAQYGIDAQLQINQQNIDQAELAYQRSTYKAQLKQLIDAGFSEVAARQVLAGNGAGSYAAPSLTAPSGDLSGLVNPAESSFNAQMAQLNAANTAISGIGQLASVGGQLIEQITSPYGGNLGALSANDFVNTLYEHMDEIPPEYRTSFGIYQLANSPTAPQWLKDSSKQMKKAFSSVGGRIYVDGAFEKSYEYDNTRGNLDLLHSKRTLARLDVLQRELNFDEATKAESLSLMSQSIKSQNQIEVSELELESWINGFRKQIVSDQADAEKASYDLALFRNPKYRQDWLVEQMSSVEGAAIMAQIVAANNKDQSNLLNSDPATRKFFVMSKMLKELGYDNTEVGQAISFIISGGVQFTGSSTHEQIKDILKRSYPLLGAIYDKVSDSYINLTTDPGGRSFGYGVLPDNPDPATMHEGVYEKDGKYYVVRYGRMVEVDRITAKLSSLTFPDYK